MSGDCQDCWPNLNHLVTTADDDHVDQVAGLERLSGRVWAALDRQNTESFVLLDQDMRILWANAALANLIGHPLDQLFGRFGLDFVTPESVEVIGAAFSAQTDFLDDFSAVGGKVQHPFDLELVRADGTTVRCTVGVSNLFDDREVSALLLTIRPAQKLLDLRGFVDLIARGASLAETLHSAAEAFKDVMHVPATLIVHHNRGTFDIVGSDVDLDPALAPEALWMGAWSSGVEQDVLDVTSLPEATAAAALALGCDRARVVPLRVRGETLGCVVSWYSSAAPFRLAISQATEALREVIHLALLSDRATTKLRRAAEHDPLTGLANRAGFDRAMAEVDGPAALLLIDLDDFKPVNDRFGHHVGDQVLMEVAWRISTVVRDTDLVARIGGDEFAVLCPGRIGDRRAVEVAGAIVAAVAAPIDLGGTPVTVGASIGLHLCADAAALDQAVVSADRAMYRAKQAGKGRVVHSSPED